MNKPSGKVKVHFLVYLSFKQKQQQNSHILFLFFFSLHQNRNMQTQLEGNPPLSAFDVKLFWFHMLFNSPLLTC